MNSKNCLYCLSENTCFTQLRKNKGIIKEIHRCKECNRRFTPNNSFKKFRFSPVVIKTSLELLSQGASYGEISNYIRQNFRLQTTRKTILDWKRKFANYKK